MKFRILIFIISLSSLLFSCNNEKKKQSEESEINKKNLINLKIKGDIHNLLQIDSIFNDITTIPLETKEECLIKEIVKVLFHGNKMFLQDEAQKLLVFDTNGKFLKEIGKKGKGPGEFLELRDFDIDKDGNIYILDRKQILKYNNDGTFLKGFSYHFSPTDKTFCIPFQFATKDNDNFYIWGGSLGLKDNSIGNFFAMYEMTKGGKITNKYFPVKYNISGSYNQFKRYKELLLIDPVFGSNVIYSINKEGVGERYYIDFGRRTLDIPVPEGFLSLVDFKTRIDSRYFHSIFGFIETNDWIYFMFVFKRHVYNVYFSKKLNKSFLSIQWPLVSGRIAPWKISAGYNDNFFAFIEPKYVIEDITKCKVLEFDSLPASEKRNIERLAQIKPTDNPILFICSMKNY
jgi:hypothetical protein